MMDYDELHQFNYMKVLDDDEDIQSNLNSFYFHNVSHGDDPSMKYETEGCSVFCEQTVLTISDTCNVTLNNLVNTELIQLADHISYIALDVVHSLKKYLIGTQQLKLTPLMINHVLQTEYGFRCYGHEVETLYHPDDEHNEENNSNQQQKVTQLFSHIEDKHIKNLYTHKDVTVSCINLDTISYNVTDFHIKFFWLPPPPVPKYYSLKQEELDKQMFDGIIRLLLSNVNVPYSTLFNHVHINRISLQLLHCVFQLIRAYIDYENILNRIFDFVIAFVHSKHLISPGSSSICIQLLQLVVSIITENLRNGRTLPLSHDTKQKAASLVADLISKWEIGTRIIANIVDGLDAHLENPKGIESQSGTILILAALDPNIFKHSLFLWIQKYFLFLEKLYLKRKWTSPKENSQALQDIRFRDSLFHVAYGLYKDNNFLQTTKYTNQEHIAQFVNGDLSLYDYFGDLAILIRHDNYRLPQIFVSTSLNLYQPELVLDLSEKKIKVKRKIENKQDFVQKCLNVYSLERTANFFSFVDYMRENVSSDAANVANMTDLQMLLDDTYYRAVDLILQATTLLNEPKLSLHNLRQQLYKNYPCRIVPSSNQLCTPELVFENYKLLQMKLIRIGFGVMRTPRQRAAPATTTGNVDGSIKCSQLNYTRFCKKKCLKHLNRNYKYFSCNQLLSILI